MADSCLYTLYTWWRKMTTRVTFRCFYMIIFATVVISFIFFVSYSSNLSTNADIYEDHEREKVEIHDPNGEARALKESITQPLILWWTPFTGERGRYKTCGNVSCYFTVDRHYRNHPQTKVMMFYGTEFTVTDLPLPRNHQWGLLHEESPKNNFYFSHEEIMTLFNHTSTFRRESHYPITTQYLGSLEWLERTDFIVPTVEKNRLLSELSPLIYTHSDCGTPSDRDTYVELMMKYISVDSYGACLHNKDLPKHLVEPIDGMDHKDFYKINAKYKFTLAFENGICNDYVTEKLWRPLFVGSVPIVMGSPKIRDFLPSNHSAIIIDDFESVEDLVKYVKYLNENDEEYDKYLEWKKTGITNPYLKDVMNKREWQITLPFSEYNFNMNFIDGFECHVCKKLHENEYRKKHNLPLLKFQSTVDHYGCPPPQSFDADGRKVLDSSWQYEWTRHKYLAAAARYLISKGVPFTNTDLESKANDLEKGEL